MLSNKGDFMDKVMMLADELSLALLECDIYKQYYTATESIKANHELANRIDEFKKRHLQYVINKAKNIDSFDEERYLSQEYYKIILNEDARVYFEKGLMLIDMMNKIYKKLASGYAIDVFLGDEK